VALEDGLKRTIDWFRETLDDPAAVLRPVRAESSPAG
jgi:hypothetical protein